MVTTASLADAIGRKTMADALGVLPTAVSNGVVRGAFPASWFLVVKALADARGIECPPDLFGMRPPPQSVDESAADQGPERKGRAA